MVMRAKNQSRTCRGASRSTKIKFENQTRTCKGTNTFAKTRFEYQSRRMFKDIYDKSNFYNQRFKKYLNIHSTICSLKC
jgi:hypothetical protein